MQSKNLHELVIAASARWSSRIAFRHIYAGKVRDIRYADIPRLSYLYAEALTLRGAKAGDRIILCADNSPEWVFACIGAMRAGLTVVPVDARSRQADMETIAEKVRPALFVLGHAQHALLSPSLDEGKVALIDTVLEIIPTDLSKRGTVHFNAIPTDHHALIVFTSGTSGASKGVVLSHGNIQSNVNDITERYDVSTDDRLLSVLPLSHMFEFTAGLIGPLVKGATIVYCRLRGPEHLKEVLQIEKISVLIGVPAIYQNVAKAIEANVMQLPPALRSQVATARKLSTTVGTRHVGRTLLSGIRKQLGGNVKFWAAGGAPVPANLVNQLGSVGIPVLAGYGLTEASPVVAANTRSTNRPGSVGRPLSHVDVEIAITDENAEPPVGEILVRGPNVMQGYLDDEDATKAVIKEGWLHTGDIGHFDEDGFLYVTGRSKSTIITAGGYNIQPEELEQALQLSPLIQECCVFGMPADLGEQVHAMIVPASSITQETSARQIIQDEIAKCFSDLAEYKRLSGFQLSWDKLPRTRTAKVERPAVIAQYMQLQESRDSEEPPASDFDEDGRVICEIISELIEPSLAEGKCAPEIRRRASISADLGIDSFARLELALRLEEHFSCHIPEDMINDVQTVNDLVILVKARRNAGCTAQDETSLSGMTDAQYDRATRLYIHLDDPQHGTFSSIVGSIVPWPNYQAKARSAVDSAMVEMARKGLLAAIKSVLRVYSNFEIFGKEHLSIEPPFIVAANHSSHVDTAAIFACFESDQLGRVHPVAAADTFFVDKFSSVLSTEILHAIPFDRYGQFEYSMSACEDVLKRGEILIMFPEGTRSTSGELGTFRHGVAQLAVNAGCPVVPAYISGAFQMMPKKSLLPKPGKLEVHFGVPVQPPPNGKDYTEVQALTKRVRDSVAALRAEVKLKN